MAKSSPVRVFHLAHKGLERALGRLEAAVMEVAWPRGTVSIRDVQEALARDQTLSFNTVMTVMNRLVDKGLLRRTQGKPNSLYEPEMSREEFCRTLVRQAAEGLVTDFGALAVAQFVKALDTVNPALLDQLSHLLHNRGQHES